MDIQLQQAERQLENVTKLGIVGMGGVGKTTLAMATFNKLGSMFDYTCFVHDMKPIIESIGHGKDKVRKELWKCMHCKGMEAGDKEEWFKLKNKSLLLVLDNVSGGQDCEVLLEIANDTSPHSRFITTSRNRDDLYSMDAIYQVHTLDEDDAQEFFLSQAFPNHAQPSTQLACIMKDVVKKCDGLPLTIQVIGRSLKGKQNDEVWKQTLAALDIAEAASTFDERLWEKLRTSYEGLKKKEKQMFLDASTFFSNFNSHLIHNWTLREAKAAWKAAYKTPSETVLWNTLVDRCLVYDVKDHENIRVHEQLQSLGRRIAEEPNNNRQCRVWKKSVAMELLEESSEFDNEEYHAFRLARHFCDLEEITIPRSALRKFKRLKYLDFLGPVVIDEADDSESFPSRVVLLRCSGLQIFNPNLQRHLVVLNLDLDVTSLPCSIGQLQSLRIFTLRAPKLESLPDEIGDLSQLEFLEFSHLDRLQDLPKTFGELSKIKHLIFKICYKLHALPECFGFLSSLKHLEFHYCPKLHALPESFCHLSLERLEFTQCEELNSLPQRFGELTALKHLELLALCNLDSLPKSFGKLRNLQYLKLSAGAERRRGMITKLPDCLAELMALRHLILDGISVTSLPESIKRISSLQTLELKDLLYVRETPSWLTQTHGGPLALSHKIFRVQDEFFALIQEDTTRLAKDVIQSLKERAEEKVWALDYDGALADLRLGDLGVLEPQVEVFLLNERSKIKRKLYQRAAEKVMASDYEGALADLRPEDPGVIDSKLEANLCQWRIQITSLLFYKRATEKVRAFDYDGALASLRPEDPGMVEPLLEELLLKERKKIMVDIAMAKMSAGDSYAGALADLSSEDLRVVEPHLRKILLDRAVVKMRALDYEGALADVRHEDLGMVEPELRETSLRVRGVIILALYERAMEKVRANDFDGALADLRPEDPGVVELGLLETLWGAEWSHKRLMDKVRAKNYEGALADLHLGEPGVGELLRPKDPIVVESMLQSTLSRARMDTKQRQRINCCPQKTNDGPCIQELKDALQMNDSVFELYRPKNTPKVQIVFFHGLQMEDYSDAQLSAWQSGDGSTIWPQTWLIEDISGARVLSISYSGVLRYSSAEGLDMYLTGDNLLSDLLQDGIGQVPQCPVVLVGHSTGGLVIKELLIRAHDKLSRTHQGSKRAKLELFLKCVRGIFYYATPHHGSGFEVILAKKILSPLSTYFETLSKDTARLNSIFEEICKVHYKHWLFAGLGEALPTNLGPLKCGVAPKNYWVVPESSARGENFNVVEEADHFSVCRPRSKKVRSFTKLRDFVSQIASNATDAENIKQANVLSGSSSSGDVSS